MPIVFIASEANVPAAVRAMIAGAVEIFTKPLRDDVLIEAVGGALETCCEMHANVEGPA